MSRKQVQVLWIGVFVVLAWVGSAAADDPTPACQLGRQLRGALGFGAQELAVMGVDGAAQTSIVNAATSFCDLNRGTIESLIVAVQDARQAAFGNYEIGADTTGSDQALLDAISALEAASG